MAVQTVRPPVDDQVGRDLGAKVPPGQAFGLVGLDWLRTVMRAGEHRGVFETAVEKGAVRVTALSRCWRRSSTERQPIQWGQATCCLGLARIGDTPTALQRCLTQSYSPAASNYPQLIPASLQHWRGDLNLGIAQLQPRTFGGDGKRRSTLDRQDGLRPSVEQPGLDPNDDRAWIGQCERLGGDNESARPQMDRLETRRVGAGKSCWHVLELDTRPGRIGIGVDDPHEVGAVRPIQLAGDLDRDRLARARREPVDITDQRNHGSNLSLQISASNTSAVTLMPPQRRSSKPKRNDPSCDRIQPAVGVGKWAGMIMTGLSAKVSMNLSRVARAISASTQKQLLSWGSAHCSGVCMISPLRTTDGCGDPTTTQTWPVCAPPMARSVRHRQRRSPWRPARLVHSP